MLLEAHPKTVSWPNGCVRRHPRTPFSVPLKFHHLRAGTTLTSSGMSLDLSEGGLGALVNGKLLPGETVEIELPLQKNSLRLIAIVRYCSNFGSGVEFLGLTPEERSHIAEATTREAARSPAMAKLIG
ncbi:MAG: PilZ domain-containing protein [Terriglobales bacterium]